MIQPLFEPASGILTVPYAPDEHSIISENPPRFTWMAAQLERDRYVLEISSDSSFQAPGILRYGPIPYNLFTPDRVLEPGEYFWRYAMLLEDGAESTDWSRVRSFTIPEGLPETPMPLPEDRYRDFEGSHPRLWLQSRELNEFRSAVSRDPAVTGWTAFLEKSAGPWAERELVAEPKPYPENKRVAKLWRQMYIDCQEVLYAIRHLSVAGIILEDSRLTAKAMEWLLHAASWNTEGTTSRDYNDEASFRIAGALAWGYDWLYGVMTEEERGTVRKALFRRTEQVAYHVIERSKIHHVPYDSHAVRSLSSVLVPCCIALLGEEEKAKEWLDYTLDYYSGLYSPWGGQDGGWAEGPMYWTTGMAFVTEAFNLIRKFNGINFYKRPFFTRTGDFPLYVYSPDTVRASFCDQSSLGDPVNLKTGCLMRQFAGLTGNGHYQWYYEKVLEQDKGTDMMFYNYGWWDFRFDDLTYRWDFPSVTAVEPQSADPVKWFRDVGWVAMHHRMDDPGEHIMLLAKSSRYGSVSHSHGDQNGFVLHAYGEPLAIDSGYYVAFNSTMHMKWRKQTRSKNLILIDGQGQYAGTDKVKNMAACGSVISTESREGFACTRMDATDAYRETVPYMKRYVREIYFMDNSYAVIVDLVDLAKPGRMDWLFHTLHPMTLKGQAFTVNGVKAQMEGRFVYSSSGDLSLSQHDRFTEVDPAEIEGLPNHWHLTAAAGEATSHRLVTLLVPRRSGESRYVSYFMDDQDHGVHLYFTDQGITRKIEVAKAY
jgi:hypothetical protein